MTSCPLFVQLDHKLVALAQVRVSKRLNEIVDAEIKDMGKILLMSFDTIAMATLDDGED